MDFNSIILEGTMFSDLHGNMGKTDSYYTFTLHVETKKGSMNMEIRTKNVPKGPILYCGRKVRIVGCLHQHDSYHVWADYIEAKQGGYYATVKKDRKSYA